MGTDSRYTISQLARAAETPTSTLRYYERIGLLKPEDRSQGNYRLYGDQSHRRLRFIRAAQAIGFTLDAVNTLLGDHQGLAPTCHEVQSLIEERLADIEKRLKDLRHVKRVLKSSLKKCLDSKQDENCQVIDTLRSTSLE